MSRYRMGRAWAIPAPAGGVRPAVWEARAHPPGRGTAYDEQPDGTVAAINGLRALTEACRVTAITDSRHLQQGMTYLLRWRSLGWCNSRGEAIANRDLWELLASVASQHETKWHWVRGHGSDPDQDRCDVLAKESARTVAARGTAKDLAA